MYALRTQRQISFPAFDFTLCMNDIIEFPFSDNPGHMGRQRCFYASLHLQMHVQNLRPSDFFTKCQEFYSFCFLKQSDLCDKRGGHVKTLKWVDEGGERWWGGRVGSREAYVLYDRSGTEHRTTISRIELRLASNFITIGGVILAIARLRRAARTTGHFLQAFKPLHYSVHLHLALPPRLNGPPSSPAAETPFYAVPSYAKSCSTSFLSTPLQRKRSGRSCGPLNQLTLLLAHIIIHHVAERGRTEEGQAA